MNTIEFLADTGGESLLPGTAVPRTELTPRRTGTFDGAWWPRSRDDVESQLPCLFAVPTDRLGLINRAGVPRSSSG